jgi:hypothetical protein
VVWFFITPVVGGADPGMRPMGIISGLAGDWFFR